MIEQEAFEEAVGKATSLALTRLTSDDHFLRALRTAFAPTRRDRVLTVIASALAAAIAAIVIALPVTLVLSHRTHEEALTASYENCRTSAAARPQGNARAFVQTFVTELASDLFAHLPPKFQTLELAKLNARLIAERELVPGQFPEHVITLRGERLRVPYIKSFSELETVVRPLPLLHCSKGSGSSGPVGVGQTH